ncbi:phage portal protein family protein [Sphingomonas sp. SRS2]|uniref:phage portal protein family protein n=1 Tax=Sphingomonas sp. SRS2 TaxID=133190 RepID=UPI000697FC95|nr:DUF935 family protein [Sphingomonas sp. SRS2]
MARQPRKKELAAPIAGEIATTRDGRDITRPWIMELQQPRNPRLLHAIDWGVYDRVLADPEVRSTFQQRRRAVTSAEWDIIPGEKKNPRSVDAADKLKANLERVGVDRFTDKMLYALPYGYSVAELIWGYRDGFWQFADIKVRHARRFRWDKENRLRLLTSRNMQGEILEDRKFWPLVTGASDDDETYGRGFCEDLYWPTLFKRNGIGFWNTFLDKFGNPTAKGTYRRGTPQADVEKLLGALAAISTDAGFVVPEGVVVELLEASRSGTGDFEKLVRYMDEAIAKVVLSQTMTTSSGSSLSQAEVHAGVKLEVVTGDADLICESFNLGPATWWCEYNFGADVEPPQLVRLIDAKKDLKTQAETDGALKALGWERTDESYRDTYGDGYERSNTVDPTDPKAKIGAPGAPPVNDNAAQPVVDPSLKRDERPVQKPISFAAADPRPLYVSRPLLNSGELLDWATRNGFTATLAASELHVTVAYSRRPVNWFAMGSSWDGPDGKLIVPPGGPRSVDLLGDSIVLHFDSPALRYRNEEMREKGASWDYPTYQAHVSIAPVHDGIGYPDLAALEPFEGELRFGPERFRAIESGYEAQLAEISFAEALIARDTVDQAVDMIIAEGWEPLRPIVSPIAAAIAAATSAEELDELLIKSLDQSKVDELTEALARAGFAIRTAEEGGTD